MCGFVCFCVHHQFCTRSITPDVSSIGRSVGRLDIQSSQPFFCFLFFVLFDVFLQSFVVVRDFRVHQTIAISLLFVAWCCWCLFVSLFHKTIEWTSITFSWCFKSFFNVYRFLLYWSIYNELFNRNRFYQISLKFPICSILFLIMFIHYIISKF